MPRDRNGRDDRVLKERDINIRGETASTVKRRLSGDLGIDRGYEMPKQQR
jgi:hypothetical protein